VKNAGLLSTVLSVLLLATLALMAGGCTQGNIRAQTDQDTIKYSRIGYETLFNIGTLHEIEIIISDAEWQGILDDMRLYAMFNPNNRPLSDTYHKATFVYRGPAGDAVIEEVGFRTKGNVNRPYPEDRAGNLHKAHFKIKFNEIFDQLEGTAEWDDRNQRRFAKQRELELRMNSHNAATGVWDTSQIRELYGYEMMRRAGVYTSRVGSARLWITIGGQKHYFGIHTIIETIDKSFLTKKYGSNANDGNLYKCRWGDSGPANLGPIDDPENFEHPLAGNPRIIGIKDSSIYYRPTYDLKTNKVTQDHSGFLSFINNLNTLSGAELKEYMDEIFEVDNFLRYLAMNVLLGKWDDYWSIGNNYYLYFNNRGKIEYIPTDYDMILGEGFALFDTFHIGIYDWGNHNRELLQVMAPDIPEEFLEKSASFKYPLVDKIFEIEEYRQTYEHYLDEFMRPGNNMFTFAEYERMFNQHYELYSPYLDNDINEGEDMYIGDLARKYFYERTISMIEQLGLNEADYALPVIDTTSDDRFVKQLPAREPVEETSFESKEIRNERYNFSFRLPVYWADTTNTQLHEALAVSKTSGVFVSWWVNNWEDNFSEIVKLTLTEGPVDIIASGSTVLSGGTEAGLVEYLATIVGNRMHLYSIGVRRGIGWITINLWNIDRYGEFDRALFEEIAHTLRFEQP